jgi:hypothetical protein
MVRFCPYLFKPLITRQDRKLAKITMPLFEMEITGASHHWIILFYITRVGFILTEVIRNVIFAVEKREFFGRRIPFLYITTVF